MPVDAQLGVVGEVRAELQEERAEVVVDGVEVELVDHRRRGGQPRVGVAGGGVVAALGAYHLRLLLRLADVEDALAAGPPAEVLPGTVVLALAAAEQHDLDVVAGGEALDGVDEALGHGGHQGRGRYGRAAHLAEEVRRPRGPLEQGHVDVEVHPVDALQGQGRVLYQTSATERATFMVGLRSMGSSPASLRPPSPPGDHEGGFAPRLEQQPESTSNVSRRRGLHASSV